MEKIYCFAITKCKEEARQKKWRYRSRSWKAMKKLVFSSTSTPLFNFNHRSNEKLSQNINIHFNNTDKVSCNDLSNFDPKFPADHTTSNPYLPEMDGFVQHDSKIKNTMNHCKTYSSDINQSFPDFDNAQHKHFPHTR